jgi:predicted DNA-binding transcriptional regulator AlpA
VSERVAQVRGVLAERVVVSTQLDPFLTLRALAAYAGLSVRTLRTRLVDPIAPLPHYKIGGKIVVRRSDYDQWVARYRHVGLPEVNRLVDEVFSGPGRRR